ncbi:MAG: hypothetical protein M0R48_00770 [Candidatus Omnitrophica bacterium]|jgi:sRNA-binding regulator protein Hfq|nr:hypothetical protein [Candidatus Omnitrophota bacterium]
MIKKLILFLFCILITISVYAQITVYLKNGRQVQGYFVSIDNSKIVIAQGRGNIRMSLYKEEIDKIEGFTFEEFSRAKDTYEAGHFEGKEKGFASSYKDAVKMVSEKRGLEFISEVKNEMISRENIKKYMEKKLQEEVKDEEIEQDKKLLVKLGIISPGADYKKMIIELFTRNVAGFYEPKENKMYVVDEAASSFSPFLPSEVVIHELVHALQDQYIMLDYLDEDLKKANDDKALAMKSVIEGEATYVSFSIMADYIKKRTSGGPQSKVFDSMDMEKFILESMMLMTKSLSPEFENKALIHYLLFPYINGGLFIKYAYDNGGWKKVDSVYKNYPLSTEQIIHPEKYFLVEDKPLPLPGKNFSFLAQDGYKEISKGTLGEFTIYTLGITFLDDLYAKMLSVGWGNDSYYLYEKEGKLTLIMDTRWDSVLEAEEFFKGMKALMDKKYANLKWNDKQNFMIAENEGNIIYIGKKDDGVMIIEEEGKDKSTIEKVTKICVFPYS